MAAHVVPFIGFAPDASEMTPGVITSCYRMLPSERGMRGAPWREGLGFDALPAACVSSSYVRRLNGIARVFAGTATGLYERDGTTWHNWIGTSGATGWSFAQLGDYSLATDDVGNIYGSSASSFTAIANAPKAKIVIAVPNFAVAFNTQNGSASTSFGDSPDRWWCSAYQNPTDWAISAANQCVSERLIGGGGEITAAAPFGTGWVVYKEREMFHAYYSGGAEVFNTQRVPGNQGCVGPNAVADVNGAHAFVGLNDIYIYDGSRVASIAEGKVRRWLFSRIKREAAAKTKVLYEQAAGLLWVFYPVGVGTSSVVGALVYHFASGRWGHYDDPSGIGAAMLYPGEYGNDDTVAYFDASGSPTLGTITDTTSAAYVEGAISTGWYGSDDRESFVSRVQLLSDDASTIDMSTPSVSTKSRARSGADVTTGASVVATASGNFDLRQTARWHKFEFTVHTDAEISGMTLHMRPAGQGR